MRPSSLYRSDSRREPMIEANANNIHEDSIDCGVTALKCCNTPQCQKLANKKTFTTVLVFCAIIQGAIESYFRTSAIQSARTHDFDPRIVDWLLVTSGVLQGCFAIFVAYWGNRIHRPAWLGGIFMLQSVLCIILIIPTLVHNDENNNTVESIETSILCIHSSPLNLLQDNNHGITTLILLFVLQLGIALGLIAFYTLGFSYLDDNVNEHESPALLSAALASKFWGVQFGHFTSFIVGLTPFDWFLGWTLLAPILFIIGLLAVMFPRRLLSTVVKQATNTILESATNTSHASLANTKFIADIDFLPTILRLFTNKILLLNIFAAAFVQTAFINFTRHEANYLQSRFFLPILEADGISNEWTSHLVTSLLKPPMVALGILVAGLLISKVNPNPRKLVVWNIVAASLVVLFFIVSIFIDCENSPIAGSHRGKINKPYCASSCFCSENVPFLPVCPENGVQTYFSPCYAGCTVEIVINNVRVFGNCTCGVDTQLEMTELIATEGACGMDDCKMFWISHQVLSVIATALLGSTLIGKIIISLRSVLPQDKCTALGLELFLVCLMVYLPGKIGYRVIANKTCQYVAPDNFRCFLQESPLFGNWLNVVTAGLIIIGIIFEVLLLISVSDLHLYGDEPEDVYRPIEMNNLRSNEDGTDNDTSQSISLLQRYGEQSIPSNNVQYAQIIRPAIVNDDQFDFRLQSAQPALGEDNSSIISEANRSPQFMSAGSSISSGYIDLTVPNRAQRRVVRPTSPETSF